MYPNVSLQRAPYNNAYTTHHPILSPSLNPPTVPISAIPAAPLTVPAPDSVGLQTKPTNQTSTPTPSFKTAACSPFRITQHDTTILNQSPGQGSDLSLRAQLIKLQGEVDEYKRIADRRAQELHRRAESSKEYVIMQQRCENAEKRELDLQNELNRAVEEIHYLRMEVTKSNQRCIEGDSERVSLRGTCDELEARIFSLESTRGVLEETKKQLVVCEENKADLQFQLDNSAEGGKMLRQENEKLRGILQAGMSILGVTEEGFLRELEKVTLRAKLCDQQEVIISQLEGELSRNEGSLSVLHSQLQLVEASASSCSQERDILSERNAEFLNDIAKLTQTLAEAEKAASLSEREVGNLRSINTALESKLNIAEDKVKDTSETLSVLSIKNKELEQESQHIKLQLNSLQLENTEIRQNLLSSESRVRDIQAELQLKLESLAEGRKEQDRLRAQSDDLERELHKLNELQASKAIELSNALQHSESENASLLVHQDELQRRFEQSMIEKRSLQRDVQRVTNEAATLRAERDTAAAEAKELLAALAACEAEIESLRSSNKELSVQLHSRQSNGFDTVRVVLEQRLAAWADDNEKLHNQLQIVTNERNKAREALQRYTHNSATSKWETIM